MRTPFLTAVLALSATVVAQQTFVLPDFTIATSGNSVPFGSIPVHYQVWYSASQMASALGHPARLTQVDFMTFATGQTGGTLQLEVRIANSVATQPSGNFANNLVSGETLIHPQFLGGDRSLPLTPTAAGAFALSIPFQNEFEYDGQSGLVIDIRIFDNGTGQPNTPFNYELATETFGTNNVVTLYNVNGGPTSTGASTILQRGPRIQLTFSDGISVPFGDGCPGEGSIVPVHGMSGGDPVPNNPNWTHVLTAAPSQRQAIWMFGASRTDWSGIPLPHEFVEIGANGCYVLVRPDLTAAMQTVGGGAGTGFATLTTPTPPTTDLVGLEFFTQWLILDPLSANGVLAASNGMWHIFGP